MDDQISFARQLRRDQTPAERRFWALLHPWREAGWHFRRQAPIGPFVVDFVCKRNKLVFEIDGDSHYSDEGVQRDIARTAYLRRLGYSVMRFTNVDVLECDDGVFAVLRGVLGEPEGRTLGSLSVFLPLPRGRSGGGLAVRPAAYPLLASPWEGEGRHRICCDAGGPPAHSLLRGRLGMVLSPNVSRHAGHYGSFHPIALA